MKKECKLQNMATNDLIIEQMEMLKSNMKDLIRRRELLIIEHAEEIGQLNRDKDRYEERYAELETKLEGLNK